MLRIFRNMPSFQLLSCLKTAYWIAYDCSVIAPYQVYDWLEAEKCVLTGFKTPLKAQHNPEKGHSGPLFASVYTLLHPDVSKLSILFMPFPDRWVYKDANFMSKRKLNWISIILYNPRKVKQSGKIISFRISGLLKLTFKGLYSKKWIILLRSETRVKFRQPCCESEAPRPERIKRWMFAYGNCITS